MLNTITTQVKFIKRNHILWEIIPDTVVYPKFTLNCFFCSKQIRNLDIEFLILPATYKINLFFSCLTDSNNVAPAKQLQINNVFKNEINIPHITAIDSFSDTVVSNVIFFVC